MKKQALQATGMAMLLDRTRRILGWYCGAWWHPLLLTLPVFALLAASSVLSMAPGWGGPFEKLAGILLLVLALHLAATFLFGMALVFRRRFLRGALYCLQGVLFICLELGFALGWSVVYMILGTDHFADNLRLPEGIELLEPCRGRYGAGACNDIPDWSVLADASVDGIGLDEGEQCRLPALERLMETSEGERRLLDYLAASPYWTVLANDVDGVYAYRNISDGYGGVSPSVNHLFVPASHADGRREGRYANFGFRIYLSGLPDRLFASKVKDYDCIPYRNNGENGRWEYDTWLKAGRARVYVNDGSEAPGRRMTRRMLELVDEELSALDMSGFGKNAPQEVVLFGDLGHYRLDVWCNPGESGTISVSAREITRGTPLSNIELSKNNARIYGAPDGLVYYSGIDFMIYEGNWGQYYGARLELWFTPDGGGPKRRLWEGDCKIQGWQR